MSNVITENTGLNGKPVNLIFLPPAGYDLWETVADFGDGITIEQLSQRLSKTGADDE